MSTPILSAQQFINRVVIAKFDLRIHDELRDARPGLLAAPLVIRHVFQLRQGILHAKRQGLHSITRVYEPPAAG